MSIATVAKQPHARSVVVRRDPCMRCAALPPRQAEVLRLMAKGLTNKQIGAALGISPNTVREHARRIYETLGVTSRTEAAMLFARFRERQVTP